MYDFETVVNRHNTGSSKWEQMKKLNPNVSDKIIPFSVADMELKNPPEIIEGLKNYLDSTILGYANPTERYYNAVCNWMWQRHQWKISPELIVGSPGVVGAFYSAIKAFSNPNEGVIVMTPSYYPFYNAVNKNNRKLVRSPLIENGLIYEIDYEDLDMKAKDPNNKILLFCSPHNPTGRVWRRDELEKIGEICLRNNILIISDEIHFDLIMPEYKHTVFASISEELAKNMIVCTAPSKTFNLAGLQVSNIIIPNKDLRHIYTKELQSNGLFNLNILGYKACEIAYTECEAWLDQLINLIYNNHILLKEYIKKNIPSIKVFPLQGTYLQWMGFHNLRLNKNELEEQMHKAGLFFNEGYIFGKEGNGYERMNLACPKQIILEALERLKKAVDTL